MPFVSRDISGRVSGIFLKSHPEAAEFLPGDHADILQFFGGVIPKNLETPALVDLSHSDIEFIRVIEDVLDLLIRKKVLNFTELPKKVRDKILSRKGARERLTSSNDIMVPDEGIL